MPRSRASGHRRPCESTPCPRWVGPFQETGVCGDSTYCIASVVRISGKNLHVSADHAGTQPCESEEPAFVPQPPPQRDVIAQDSITALCHRTSLSPGRQRRGWWLRPCRRCRNQTGRRTSSPAPRRGAACRRTRPGQGKMARP
ncbi:hypothetical protein AMK16_26865 [Streptomyces sp. CB00455]|nr:hypothetical protein AMK16_26865 [Streptomyces sp. CB00455]